MFLLQKPQAIGKIQVLVRQDPYSSAKKLKENIEKTKVTETQDVEYLGPSSGHIYNLKRSSGKKVCVYISYKKVH